MHCLVSIMIDKFSSTLRNIKVFDVYIYAQTIIQWSLYNPLKFTETQQ